MALIRNLNDGDLASLIEVLTFYSDESPVAHNTRISKLIDNLPRRLRTANCLQRFLRGRPQQALCHQHSPIAADYLEELFVIVTRAIGPRLKRFAHHLDQLSPEQREVVVTCRKIHDLWQDAKAYQRLWFEPCSSGQIPTDCKGCVLTLTGSDRETIVPLYALARSKRSSRRESTLFRVCQAWIKTTALSLEDQNRSERLGAELSLVRKRLKASDFHSAPTLVHAQLVRSRSDSIDSIDLNPGMDIGQAFAGEPHLPAELECPYQQKPEMRSVTVATDLFTTDQDPHLRQTLLLSSSIYTNSIQSIWDNESYSDDTVTGTDPMRTAHASESSTKRRTICREAMHSAENRPRHCSDAISRSSDGSTDFPSSLDATSPLSPMPLSPTATTIVDMYYNSCINIKSPRMSDMITRAGMMQPSTSKLSLGNASEVTSWSAVLRSAEAGVRTGSEGSAKQPQNARQVGWYRQKDRKQTNGEKLVLERRDS